VSEWFGQRTYPAVAKGRASLSEQEAGRCPFLSSVVGTKTGCIKPATSSGVCTVSSNSNGRRQDWLVCPYRALDKYLFESAARKIFGVAETQVLELHPAPTLVKSAVQQSLRYALKSGGAAVVYLQDKLGGEISIPPTDRSPELAFDITMAQLQARDDKIVVERYGIFEIQTMDFHGSYKHAVANLKDALRLHRKGFARELERNPKWLSEKVEGPNIANVFKRTFYQILLKFRIANHGSCAGSALAVPTAVWDSWQRHLGKPELSERAPGLFALRSSNVRIEQPHKSCWIYVFDIDSQASSAPNPIRIDRVIETDPDSLADYAFRVAPEAATAQGGAAEGVLTAVQRRLSTWWPELAA
jgi:hypothetical protein